MAISEDSPSRTGKRRLALFSCVTVLIALIVVDLGFRLAMEPSDRSSGKLFGYEMPPLTLPIHQETNRSSERTRWYKELVVDGARISIDDLWGYQRPDPVTGYAPEENRISTNGWWQSNDLGAHERAMTPRATPEGKRRILVFGDSYAQASRVPQEESWPYLLQSTSLDLDVVNLGVDGYGTGQAFLRYRQLAPALDYDLVWLVWVPVKDLWREINTVRSLAKDWGYHAVLPRFVVDGEEVRLVSSPFSPDEKVDPSRLRDHLQQYDRFYIEAEFDRPGPLGKTMVGKLAWRAAIQLKKRSLYSRVDPDSEAVAVTRGIARSMRREVEEAGGRFMLVVLPSRRDLELLGKGGAAAEQWRLAVDSVCAQVACVDLSGEMLALDPSELDLGYDGTHFGPATNAHIARLLGSTLSPP